MAGQIFRRLEHAGEVLAADVDAEPLDGVARPLGWGLVVAEGVHLRGWPRCLGIEQKGEHRLGRGLDRGLELTAPCR